MIDREPPDRLRVDTRVNPSGELRRIAVDLTQLRPGGENGGAKLVALSLVRQWAKLAPEVDITLLTVDRSHHELEPLDGPHVHRVCVMREPDPASLIAHARAAVRERLAATVPPQTLARLRMLYWAALHRKQRAEVPRAVNADLVFSPLTTASFFDPEVPLVALVHDLQHVYFPAFFTPEQRHLRQQQLEEACRRSDRVVCVSHHVRDSLLAATTVRPESVTVIYHALLQELPSASAAETGAVLHELGLTEGRFLLYPANFWPHKNHRVLLEALQAYVSRHPDSSLALVCTGAPNGLMEQLRKRAQRGGLAGRVMFPGHLPGPQLAALLQSCQALIYPSLFEGFGMPVLEAMACGKPVLCSNVASLPEVAGDAALFFDPTDAGAVERAIERVEIDAELVARLVERGRRRVVSFGTATDMAQSYLRLFRTVVHTRGIGRLLTSSGRCG